MSDTITPSTLWALPEHLGLSTSSSLLLFLATCGGLLALLLTQQFGTSVFSKGTAAQQTLRDPIPGLYNTLQFMFNNYKFMTRVQAALQRSRAKVLRFSLGNKAVYLVTGQQNIRTVFGRDLVHDVTNQEQMTRYALPTLYRMNASEVRRWEADRSGVTKTPIPGTEDVPSRQRLWYNYEHIYAEYLGKPQYMRPLIALYKQNLDQLLDDLYPVGEWRTVSVQKICRNEVTRTLVNTLFGPRLVELSPDFVDRLWAFDEQVFQLVMGLPKWLNAKPAKAHDAYVSAIQRWLRDVSAGFDWKEAAEADWEPRFGGRAVRELYRWMKETDWRDEVIAATLGALVFALNSNSIPTTTWMLMEIIKDPSLLQAVREEIATATETDPATGKPILDHQKLAALPLLQSIWTETLRLRINFNIMRDVKRPVVLDGGATTVAPGSLLQVPMMVAHYDEAVWGAAGHPASEFWAERHIRYVDGDDDEPEAKAGGGRVRKFAIRAGGHPTTTASWFPFGGGANVCPGRQLAKHEIFATVATVVSRFDLEVVAWTEADGSASPRAAESDLRYCGAGAMPPDRDLKIRWKRIH